MTTRDNKIDFDRGAELAWLLDATGGYRESGRTDWELTPLRADDGRNEARDVAMGDLLPLDPSRVPHITLEPTKAGTVRVKAPVRLVIQPYGETTPHPRDNDVEVAYGTVLRAGPLVFAPLYAVQARSLEDGRITLPLIGSSWETLPSDDDDGDAHQDEQTRLLTSWRWRAAAMVLAVCLALSLVVGSLAWRVFNPPPLENRILVLLKFPPQAHGGSLWFEADQELRSEGFEPVYLNSLMVPPLSCRQEPGGERSIFECARDLRAAKVMVVQAEAGDPGEFLPTYGWLRSP